MVLSGRIDTDGIAALDADQAQWRGIGVKTVRRQSEERIQAGRYGGPEEFANLGWRPKSRKAPT
ncbi:hypothetical protein [Actinosynnema sp. NPDC023587]|uniref:hypothetical protein n=1 Tax=Actinosynnema sp. NPDC023587 TaxID=3154695 RepID=UPI0033C5A6EF